MIRTFIDDRRAVVSVEFALAGVFIMTAMLNAADLGGYIYQSMQVENAAQMAVQTVLQSCTSAQLPATTTCPGLASRITSAVATTSLGVNVTIDGGAATEAYYCVDATAKLVQVGAIGSKPATCSAVGNAAIAPGDYVVVTVAFPFKGMMSGAGITALLTTPIRRSAIMRVG